VSTLIVALAVAALGALGGFTDCLISGQLKLPRFDRATGVVRPGWVGTSIVGGIAALVAWGVYGPFSAVGLGDNPLTAIHPTIAQLLSSLVVGLSGGRYLTVLADKKAEEATRDQLKAALTQVVKAAGGATP
jgi:hypothetical protein